MSVLDSMGGATIGAADIIPELAKMRGQGDKISIDPLHVIHM